jgi:hypothetical protein
VAGITTEEIMQIALKMVDMTNIPLDSAIHIPGQNIQRIIFSMDVNVGLLHVAKELGFDAVVGHHPTGVLFHRGEVYRRHIDLLELHGVPREKTMNAIGKSIDITVKKMENKRFRQMHYESPNQTILEVESARLLGMPFMNIHNPLDEQGRRVLQKNIDAEASKNFELKLKDVLELISSLPEAQYAVKHYGILPYIFLGDSEMPARKTVFVHGALSAPNPDIIRFYWENGINTVIILHNDFESLQKLKAMAKGNLILTGHFLGDSLGFTSFIRALRKRSLEVVCMGGVIDIDGD